MFKKKVYFPDSLSQAIAIRPSAAAGAVDPDRQIYIISAHVRPARISEHFR
jgi:hypothetical protein